MSSRHEWTVLLIGGASGVGKSMLADPLARRLGVHLTAIDDLELALFAATSPATHPLLHFWRTKGEEFTSWSDERRVEHHTRVCREVYGPVMQAVIADHLATSTPVVLEGDYLLPEMATMGSYGDEPHAGRVRALFLSEPDETQIAANYAAREGPVDPLRARTSRVFDELLRAECEHHGVPVVAARPWNSVVERAAALLTASARSG